MNKPTAFDLPNLSFVGTPLEQARGLLRTVRRGGDVDDAPAVLPTVLERLMSPSAPGLPTREQLATYLETESVDQADVGGSVFDPVSRADTNNPAARQALYFVIHDTSWKLGPGKNFDNVDIDGEGWKGNDLSSFPDKLTHIYINRLGGTRTDRLYTTPWRATKFETKPNHKLFRGLFLHHELVQPRMGPGSSDIDSPVPGFTDAQYRTLALLYVVASVRRGSWLIPAFHCVLDIGFGDHDDPQHFDLESWGAKIEEILSTFGVDLVALSMPVVEVQPLSFIAHVTDAATKPFRTAPAKSQTKDGTGGSSTTGLTGTITETADGSDIVAEETLSARRDGKSLGDPRIARQARSRRGGSTSVSQEGYCWRDRSLPDAELLEDRDEPQEGNGVFSGKATYFGKGDDMDEGTGTPAFKLVQTNSSVFGVSLRRERLIAEGLAKDVDGILKATERGLTTLVEVYYPKTRRLARLPLVDVGPGSAGGAATAVADLTVAATAFLQKRSEDDISKLANINVVIRVPPA
ncbi:hypothetical protein [Pinisolibacter sp.]|uniref:hypothetical protein n=1 Tax=Pinisolibacter sp. TaxID=2172024 RepID=UPI002FDD9BD5